MKRFVCPNCNKCFNRKAHLEQHYNKKNPCINDLCINKSIKIHTTKDNNINNVNEQNIVIKSDKNIQCNIIDETYENINSDSDITCEYCFKSFYQVSNLNKHVKLNCKIKKKLDEEKNKELNDIKVLMEIDKQLIKQNDELKKQNNELKKQNDELKNDLLKLSLKQIPKITNNIRKLEKTIPASTNLEISNQLVNKIIEKEKKIDSMDIELNFLNEILDTDTKQKIKNKIIIYDDYSISNCSFNYEENDKNGKTDKTDKTDKEEYKLYNKSINLILNNQIIEFRKYDNYINATQLCKAGGKKLNDWLNLDYVKNLILMLESKAGILSCNLIDKIKMTSNNYIEYTWIHPDLAIQLAQWISLDFYLQVSGWIRELYANENVNFNVKLLKEKENLIKNSEKRIKLLEDLTLKRHTRNKYPESNVVYILTDKNNKKDRIYIVGSTLDLTKRLSTYNKGIENIIVYYKSFETEELMKKAEDIVLLKLRKYQEKANRDRFILPIGEDIKLFTNVIDEAWNFFYK